MAQVRIVTDSTAYFIHPRSVKDYHLTVVPSYVQFGKESYRLGIDIRHDEVLHRIQTEEYLPKILPPTVNDFMTVYQQLSTQSSQIVSIHATPHLSDALGNAKAASQALLGRCEVALIDSGSMCVGLGMIVEKAGQLAYLDLPFTQIVREIRLAVGRLYSMYYVESMETLCHNGFMGKAQTILGSMLGIKPFITLEEGKLMVIEKAQTSNQATEKLAEFASEFLDLEQMALLTHSTDLIEPVRQLQDRLALELKNDDFPTLTYGAMTAAMLGPDAVGIVILESEESNTDGIEDTLDDDEF